jgi:hypothetical protein
MPNQDPAATAVPGPAVQAVDRSSSRSISWCARGTRHPHHGRTRAGSSHPWRPWTANPRTDRGRNEDRDAHDLSGPLRSVRYRCTSSDSGGSGHGHDATGCALVRLSCGHRRGSDGGRSPSVDRLGRSAAGRPGPADQSAAGYASGQRVAERAGGTPQRGAGDRGCAAGDDVQWRRRSLRRRGTAASGPRQPRDRHGVHRYRAAVGPVHRSAAAGRGAWTGRGTGARCGHWRAGARSRGQLRPAPHPYRRPRQVRAGRATRRCGRGVGTGDGKARRGGGGPTRLRTHAGQRRTAPASVRGGPGRPGRWSLQRTGMAGGGTGRSGIRIHQPEPHQPRSDRRPGRLRRTGG